MSVPLVMAATASGLGAPAYAAGKEHQASAKAGARRVHPRILRLGDAGPDVVRIQRMLGVSADGVFGHITLQAVKRFQAAHRLLVDGEVGPHTVRRWRGERGGVGRGRAAAARPRPGRGRAAAGARRARRRRVRPVTLHAVKRFQARHGLLVDGQVGDHTRARLHLAVNRQLHHGAHDRIQQPSGQSGEPGSASGGAGRRELGVPYVWGGESPAGFDCSGLVAYVYGRLGVSLPRVAADAVPAPAATCPRSMLRPGDLVFFHGLGHVGIYIGGGRFIHAPHTGTWCGSARSAAGTTRPTSAPPAWPSDHVSARAGAPRLAIS